LHRPPLYPFLIMPLTVLPAWALRTALVIVQGFLLGALGMLLFRLALRLFGERAAQASLALLLAYPWTYWHVKNPMAIVLQAVLYLALCETALFLYLDEPPEPQASARHWPRFDACLNLGLLAGAAILTHGTMLISATAVLFLLFAAGVWRRSTRLAATAAAALAIAVFMVAPWTIRNWRVAHQFIPVTSNSGLAYFAGNAHWGIGGPRVKPFGDDIAVALQHANIAAARRLDISFFGALDPQLSAELDARAKQHMRAHPGLVAWKSLLNLMEDFFPLFGDAILSPKSSASLVLSENALLSLVHLALLAFAALGLRRLAPVAGVSRATAAVALAAPVVIYVAPYLPFLTYVGHAQYTFGTMPFLDAAAAVGFLSLLRTSPAPAGDNA
jgi:hypothetical protein